MSKPCVVCSVLPAAAGMPDVCAAISPASASSFGSSVMLLSVRHSLRQNSFMVHPVSLTNCRSTTLKPLPPACAVRGCGQRPRGGSALSATVSMASRCQRTCCSRIFMPAALTRSGAETSHTYVQMKAGCILRWSSICGHGLLSAGQCHRGWQHNWRATPYRWRYGDVSDRRMLSFTRTGAASTAQRIIRDC